MNREASGLLVAKFGGTSMAQPEAVLSQLEYEHNAVDVVVVSAPGKSELYPVKATDMLLGFKDKKFSSGEIEERFASILQHTGRSDNLESRVVIDTIPQDLQEWTRKGDPVEALGEYWSAKLFAVQTGRSFVDAREIIFFQDDGELDKDRTYAAVQTKLGDGGKYVVPGFYGSRPDGSIQTFDRGGSDITGAIIARALNARAYDNWSDVAGFMSADPRKVKEAQLLPRITYRETRELGNGGSELLHREVINYLGGTGIKTNMRKTFGVLGNSGTEIVDNRAWQWQPIVGVTGRDDLTVVTLHEFGLNEGSGKTVAILNELDNDDIPFEHQHDATDDLAIYLGRQYKNNVQAIVDNLKRPGRTFRTGMAGLIHVVGEGLAHSGTLRFSALGAVATALANSGIEGLGASDVGSSATNSFFVKPGSVNHAINVAHHALDLGKVPRTRPKL